MAKMKTEFDLTDVSGKRGLIQIVKPIGINRSPYLRIRATSLPVFLQKDLERFAVNILKALKSKKLKP